MSDLPENETKDEREHQTVRIITVSVVASCAVIVLTCLIASTIIVVTFLQNPPW